MAAAEDGDGGADRDIVFPILGNFSVSSSMIASGMEGAVSSTYHIISNHNIHIHQGNIHT